MLDFALEVDRAAKSRSAEKPISAFVNLPFFRSAEIASCRSRRKVTPWNHFLAPERDLGLCR
jgi:hypothetical protein